MTALAEAWHLQSNIVSALVMRNMQSRNQKTRFGLFLNILEPVAMVLSIVALRWFLSGGGKVHGVSLTMFVTTGYLPYYFHRMTISDVMRAAGTKTPTLMFPMVTAFDGVLARIVNAFITYGGAMIVALVAVAGLFGGSLPLDLLLALGTMYLIFWYSAALGLIVGVAARLFPVVNFIYSPLMRVSFLFSGAIYTATELPPAFLAYLEWNPLFHGIEMMREAWMPGYVSPIASPLYLAIASLMLTVVAMTLERETRRFRLS